jgi:DNA-binding transcriptional MerR regulator
MGSHTTGDLSKRFGVPVWQILSAIRRGYLQEPRRIGCYRVFTDDDLPRIKAALQQAGYLSITETASA